MLFHLLLYLNHVHFFTQSVSSFLGHVLQKEDTDWVKKSMDYEVEGSRPRGRPKKTWKEVVQKDCQAPNLNREDATWIVVDWMMIRMVGGWVFLLVPAHLGSPWQRTVKWLLLCVVVEPCRKLTQILILYLMTALSFDYIFYFCKYFLIAELLVME